MSEEKVVSAFSEWLESERERLEESGLYPDSMLSAYQMRLAWQASRAALVVELPMPVLDIDGDLLFCMDECRAALKEAGVRVKE